MVSKSQKRSKSKPKQTAPECAKPLVEKKKFTLEEMCARLPEGYRGTEESLGPPVGKEEW